MFTLQRIYRKRSEFSNIFGSKGLMLNSVYPSLLYLGRIDDALLDEVDHALIGRIETGVMTCGFHHLQSNLIS